MVKRISATVALLLIVCFSVFANDSTEQVENAFPSDEDLNNALSVIMDCLSATVAASYSPSDIVLPSCSISFSPETGLPLRFAYFLADPYTFEQALGKGIGLQNSFFSAIVSLLQKSQQDPLLSAVYLTISSHSYDVNKYILSGFMSLSYPDRITIDEIANFLMSRQHIDKTINIDLNLSVIKVKTGQPVNIEGSFRMETDENGSIVVIPVRLYKINGKTFEGGKFLF